MKRRTAVGLATVAISMAAALPSARATLLYEQNFDAIGQADLADFRTPRDHPNVNVYDIPAGWSVTANGSDRATATLGVSNEYGVGGTSGAYLASGDGTDFNLSLINTDLNKRNFITFTYTATAAVSEIKGTFNYESAWSTTMGAEALRKGGFELGLKYSVAPPAGDGLFHATREFDSVSTYGTTSSSWHVTNQAISTVDVGVWLTDTSMLQLGLSSSVLSFRLPDVNLIAGDVLTLKWEQAMCARDLDMAQGIDNFKLNGTYLGPDGGSTLALLGLGVAGLVGLRRRQASVRN